eukprot:CAMPEP_0170563528 /NCGR_PEP_ID=MMETSP0211-20121228/67219_1 /TAXON_ID=311385 /ORGANISM="Pseudokeronopsis sp., Strain OXSARD2" /LENGTH=72 /DNA_ID=CAMNT_0010881875 /DNA_START=21 /DNA_END=235 /DNA_ORIENTATION=-
MVESSNASLDNDMHKDLGGLKSLSKKAVPTPGRNSIGPQFKEKPLNSNIKIAPHTEKRSLYIGRDFVEFKVV